MVEPHATPQYAARVHRRGAMPCNQDRGYESGPWQATTSGPCSCRSGAPPKHHCSPIGGLNERSMELGSVSAGFLHLALLLPCTNATASSVAWYTNRSRLFDIPDRGAQRAPGGWLSPHPEAPAGSTARTTITSLNVRPSTCQA
jgi:hypothetical protein